VGCLGQRVDEIEYRSPQGVIKIAPVGQEMKATKGKANPKQVNDLLRKKLS